MPPDHPSSDSLTAYRASLLSFRDNPDRSGPDACLFIDDGLLLVEHGRIRQIGPADHLLPTLGPAVPVVDYRGKLILPGFIDTHIHYPQTGIIGAFGKQLMDWLHTYTFPAERAFSDPAHSEAVATLFFDELLRNGTTTAMVFATSHPASVDAFFALSARRNTRMICGKVLMDRHAPGDLLDTPDTGYRDSKKLIEQWHGAGRQLYAITPRFAITSSDAQLRIAGQLQQEHPEVYVQTHIAENREETRMVQALFPTARNYLDVYDQFGLVHERSVFAHGIYLTEPECARLRDAGATVAFCPTSNLFLGSGLLDLDKLSDAGVNVSLATDVGAGTSFSLLQTLNEAYKVTQLQNQSLSPLKAFYMITLGNARALRLEDKIGTLAPDTEADFVVIDWQGTPLQTFRQQACRTLEERLFVLMTLGDDRAIHATYVAGQCQHRRRTSDPC